jgi:hypothetical protein
MITLMLLCKIFLFFCGAYGNLEIIASSIENQVHHCRLNMLLRQ